jgi:hypothetical protein
MVNNEPRRKNQVARVGIRLMGVELVCTIHAIELQPHTPRLRPVCGFCGGETLSVEKKMDSLLKKSAALSFSVILFTIMAKGQDFANHP